ASPGNPEVYKFFADLCFQLGDQEEGLEALRRSVRANPGDPQGLITLANALSERVRQGEAIELLWRAFEKTNELDGKLGIIERIAQLYLENNQFDRLLERLERERRESDKARAMTMCIAQAYSTAGDLVTARQQLERLLTENTRDVNLLGQLVALCESEGDIASAVKFQRLINAAAPSNYDHQLKLAQLLTRTGDADEAADIWVRLVAAETEPHRNLSSIDNLLTANKNDAALAILSRMLAQKPGNWELLYREGATLAAKGKTDYGEARMACLGWLYEVARSKGTGDAFAKQLKDAKDKAGADLRPVWDWYYFQLLRNDGNMANKDMLPTALLLSKGTDPAGMLAYLNTLGYRPGSTRYRRSPRGEDGKDATPPLPPEQLEQAIVCFRKLRQLKPEWLAHGATESMMTELKRAKRTDEEEAIYKEMVKEAVTIDKIQTALQLACNRKDTETAVALFTRL